MTFLKSMLTVSLFLVGFFFASAECTVTTPCGTYIYDTSSASVSSSSVNGVTTITVSSNGQVIDTQTCGRLGRTSVSCSSVGTGNDTETDTGNGDDDPFGNDSFDICDFVPPFLQAYFGCN